MNLRGFLRYGMRSNWPPEWRFNAPKPKLARTRHARTGSARTVYSKATVQDQVQTAGGGMDARAFLRADLAKAVVMIADHDPTAWAGLDSVATGPDVPRKSFAQRKAAMIARRGY